MIRQIMIGDRLIGESKPCFVIAEAGVNHNGEINLAHQLIDMAVNGGADAVKFQSFITEDLIVPEAPKATYQVTTTGTAGSQYPMLKSLELSYEQHLELKGHCERAGIIYLCTPYEEKSVDMLDRMGVLAFKIASTDTNNVPFLRYVSRKGRVIILSTGMSTLGEIEQAVETFREAGMDEKFSLLQCTSEYPAKMEESNLRVITTLQNAFNCPVGFSDHTQGIEASLLAVALGACIIEKHFTLDRSLPGPDHRASIEPGELKTLVQRIREVEIALGDGVKKLMPSEAPNKSRMQKSLVAKRDIPAGTILAAEDLACKRPGTGLPPSDFYKLIGNKTAKPMAKDEMFTLSSINWQS